MFYVNPHSSHSLSKQMLINILTTPCNERSKQDHSFVYQFLLKNHHLIEIQRNKSLNARLQAVAHLQISDSSPHSRNDKIIEVVQVKRDMDQKKKKKMKKAQKLKEQDLENLFEIYQYYIYIETQKLDQIMKFDEKKLRINMENLKKYAVLKRMDYAQLLHLSYYMQPITCKYKQYVYKQRDQSQYIYFVEEGQFSFQKKYVDDKNANQIQKIRSKEKNRKKTKRYQVEGDLNPNRLKISKSKQFKIGTIQGKCGQAFGDQEIIDNKIRQYSVRCESTDNKLLRIPKQIFKNVINWPKKIKQLKSQNELKINTKKQIYEKIVSTKDNYEKYAKIISDGTKYKQDSLDRQKINTSLDLKSSHKISENIGDYQSPLKSKKSIKNIQFVTHSKSRENLEKINEDQENISKIKKQSLNINEIGEGENDNSNYFGDTYPLKKAATQIIKDHDKINFSKASRMPTQNSQQKTDNSLLLPSLYEGKKKKKFDHNTIEGMVAENWSASRPNFQLKGMRNKYSGMIDSNLLIEQKQHIMSKRNMKESDREGIFPSDFIHPKRRVDKVMSTNTKKDSRVKRSAVHSKQFMQKLLIEALKKAGYNTQKNGTQKKETQSSHKGPRIIKQKWKSVNKSNFSILQQNQFDQCYFNPM